jgi:tRNA(fMet)-specific endonuclease VapC
MPPPYLLDTNIASYIIKGNISAVQRVVQIPVAQVFISSVTEGELRYGVERRPGATALQRRVEEFLARVSTLPWGSDAARAYGSLRTSLERLGRPMGSLDMMIAAHALAADAVLVTSDRTFHRIKKLKVEDWSV